MNLFGFVESKRKTQKQLDQAKTPLLNLLTTNIILDL
eukprot:SAG11_NODE_42894_length_173_cov_133.067568_1_plen_36_part_01